MHRFFFCLTSKMSHEWDWRDSWLRSTARIHRPLDFAFLATFEEAKEPIDFFLRASDLSQLQSIPPTALPLRRQCALQGDGPARQVISAFVHETHRIDF